MRLNIVIPFSFDYVRLYECLATLSFCAGAGKPGVVLVVNGDYEREILEEFKTFGLFQSLYVAGPGGIGFSGACNAGASLVDKDCDVIAFVNSDTVMKTHYYDESILDAFDKYNCDALGPVSNNACYQTVPVAKNGNPLFNTDRAVVKDVPLLNGFFYCIKKSVFEKVGGFDAATFPHYASEDDLSFKIGKKIIISNVFVEHFGSGTYSRDFRKNECALSVKKLKERWSASRFESEVEKLNVATKELKKGLLLNFIRGGKR